MYMVIFGGIRWGIHWSSWLVVLGHRRQKNCWSRQHLGIWPSDAIAASLSYQCYLSTGTPVATAISALTLSQHQRLCYPLRLKQQKNKT